MLDYIRDAAEIYRQSFATIRAEADLTPFPEDAETAHALVASLVDPDAFPSCARDDEAWVAKPKG